jgi:hypothetical protein
MHEEGASLALIGQPVRSLRATIRSAMLETGSKTCASET